VIHVLCLAGVEMVLALEELMEEFVEAGGR
jgi:hypothetical protein